MPALLHPSNPLALAVLALLFERPMHPYEMGFDPQAAAQRGEHQVSLRLALHSDRSVASARVHSGAGAGTGRATARTAPVYEITPAGSDELRTWMADLIAEPIKEYPQFEAALCLLPVLPPHEALALLRRRLKLVEDGAAALARGRYRTLAVKTFQRSFWSRPNTASRSSKRSNILWRT